MAGNSNNEIWVFLSHSNKDYEKVRQGSLKISDALDCEEYGYLRWSGTRIEERCFYE